MQGEAKNLNNDNLTRLPYKSPTLQNYGDIRDVTLGSSPGPSDSGGEGLLGSKRPEKGSRNRDASRREN